MLATAVMRPALLSVLLATSGVAMAAGPFDQADQLFAARDGSASNVAAARAIYAAALPTATGADLAYVIQQLGILAQYEGTYLLPETASQNARKAALYDQCRQASKKLDGDAAQITHFAYWKTTCTAQWMKYASLGDRLGALGEIKANFDTIVDANLEIKPELGLDTRYMGGGIYRTLSAIYDNNLSGLIRSTLPNGPKALTMVEHALASAAYPGDSNGGADYYSNYRYRAEALKFNGQTAQARQVLTDAIAEIQELIAEDSLPPGLEPETKGELAAMQSQLTALQ